MEKALDIAIMIVLIETIILAIETGKLVFG